MDLKEMEILGDRADAHWYYRAKSAAMLRMLHGEQVGEVLDVGAGSGFFSRVLLDRTAAPAAVCVDPNYAADTSEDHNGKPIRFVRAVDAFGGNVVLMMDVLEHVPDDTALLRDYAARVRPGTRFLITVPAHRWMWSGHDVFLEHYRRYTLRDVEQLILRAGLTRVATSYYFGLTLPLAAGVRLGRRLNPLHVETPGSDMRPHGALVNQVLLRLSQLELGLLGRNRVAGLSVIAVARA